MKYKNRIYTRVTKVVNGVEENVTASPQIRAAWTICDEISKRLTGKELVITSILDGKHKNESKHYIGQAFDARIFIYTPPQRNQLLKEFKNELGPDYDVILEADHFHIEYDPK